MNSQEGYLNRFVNRERMLAARLRSQRINGLVYTYDLLKADGEVCLVQEHIPGESLHERLNTRGALSIDETLLTAIKLCEALQELHNHGITHCDIKPLNIVITSPGHPVIIDLGAARFHGENVSREEIVVSPFYSAPELYFTGVVDVQPDVYSLGMTILHMLSGLPDIEGLVIGENIVTGSDGNSQRIFETMPLPNRFSEIPTQDILQEYTEKNLNRVWPPELQATLRRALAPSDQRFQTTRDLAYELSNFEHSYSGR